MNRKVVSAMLWSTALFLICISCKKDSEVAPAPSITSINKTPLFPGDDFTLTGLNFDVTAAKNTLKFGTTAVTVTSATATTLSATLPANFTTGSYEVSVTVNNQTAKLSANVDVVLPSVSSISKNPLSPGDAFTITGSNFDVNAAKNVLKFGTTAVAVSSATATTLSATLPTNFTAGNYEVSVTVDNQTTKLSAKVDVLPPTPTVTSFSPTSGPDGTVVTVTGTNFDVNASNNSITLGNLPTAIVATSATATALTFVMPNIDNGSYSINLQVNKNNESSGITSTSSGFVLVKTPNITGYTPQFATAGESITILGNNFDLVKANNVVKFDNTLATVSSATSSQLVVTVPQGLAPGSAYTLSVQATVSGISSSTAKSSSKFNYYEVANGLVAYYKFAGDTKDYSGMGNHLTATDITYSSDHNAVANAAASFNGSSSMAESSIGTSFLNSSDASVSIWYYGASSNGLKLIDETNNRLLVYDFGKSGFGQCNPSCEYVSLTVSRNTWHHLVGLYDGANKTLSLYIDNVPVATGPMNATAKFVILNWRFGFGSNTYWQGKIGKTKIYNRLLSVAEIDQLYKE